MSLQIASHEFVSKLLCCISIPYLMEPVRTWCVMLCLFSSFLSSYGNGYGSNNFSWASLDDLIRDYAFRVLQGSRTGVLNRVPIPANFSGIQATVVQLRTRNFWRMGANFSGIYIPVGIVPVPFERRLALVYQNLANWSSSFYNVPGYSLVTPVVGFMAYDASNSNSSESSITVLNLQVINDPISVSFPGLVTQNGSRSRMKCVRFDAGRPTSFSEIKLRNVCLTRESGHFSIVVPLNGLWPSVAPAPSPNRLNLKRIGREWRAWVTASGCGVAGLVLVGMVGVTVFKFVKRKKIVEMERQAEEGEALESVWVGGSRMPSATAIRTQPVLENENAP